MKTQEFRHWVFIVAIVSIVGLGVINLNLFLAFARFIHIFFALFIFMVASNSRKVSGMSVVMIIAISYFWMSVYDLLAMYSEPAFSITEFTDNDSHQLYMFARIAESGVLLTIFIFYNAIEKFRMDVLHYVFGGTVVLVIALIRYTEIFPALVINGEHTPVYYVLNVIVAISFASMIIFMQKNKKIFIYRKPLYIAFSLKIGVIIILTLLHEGIGFWLVVAHVIRLIAIYIIYNTISIDAVRDPFKTVLKVFESREEKLIQLTKTDQLTNVFNHTAINDIIALKVNECSTVDDEFNCASVLMIDVNKFKSINDKYGHQKGDEVLVNVANVLKECTNRNESVGRYGGDEFMLLIDQKVTFYIDNVVKKIREKLMNLSSDMGIEVTVSIGVATISPGVTVKEVIKRADVKMYEAKNAGEINYRIWNER